jgi:DNA-binding HxlR family transcriptional regulator
VTRERRSYEQFCAVARALDLVGERWTLLLVRELMLGPKRFKDLLEGLPGIGTNLLTDRLKVLERLDVVTRRVLPPPAGSTVYELTELGLGLEPVVLSLGRWGHQFLQPRKAGDVTQPGWFLVSLRATFHPEAVAGMKKTFGLHLDGKAFHVRVNEGEVRVSQGPATEPDVTLTTELGTLIGLLSGAVMPAAALRSGKVEVAGDKDGLARFVELFGWRGAQAPLRLRKPVEDLTIGSPA